MKIVNNRYEIVEIISDKFNSVEYLVKDLHNWGMLKVMRVFDSELSNVNFLQYFERAFVDLKNYKHPNILNLYEFAPVDKSDEFKVDQHKYFYTYEYVEEKQVHYLELDKVQTNDVYIQICKIMRFLHFKGVVYKHFNFENLKIYLKSDSSVFVKLTDLASIAVLDYQDTSVYETVSDFTAPEVSWGEKVTYSADIYSMGIVFYYLYNKLDYQKKAISKFSTTGEFNLFITNCTSQLPDDRIQSVEDFINEVSRFLWIDVDHDDYEYYDRIQTSIGLVGRDNTVDEILDLIELKTQKATSIKGMSLVGERGSGKTRVLKEISRICKFRKYNFVYISPSSDYNDYYCIQEILKNIIESDYSNSHIVSKYMTEISALVPEYFKGINNQKEMVDLEKDHLRIVNRAVHFLSEYCSNNYIIIMIDDYEVVKENDRMFFEQVMTDDRNNGVLMILSEALSSDEYRRGRSTLKFTHLNPSEIGIVIQRFLGTSYTPLDLLHRALMDTHGKASQIRKLLISFYNLGIISFNRDTYYWEFDEEKYNYHAKKYLDYVDVNESIFDGIPENERLILKKLSILEEAISKEVLFDFLSLESKRGEQLLKNWIDKKIINQTISDVEYVYSISDRDIKSLLYRKISEEDIVRYSEEIADILIDYYRKTGRLNGALYIYLEYADRLSEAAEYALLLIQNYSKKRNFKKVINLLEISEGFYRKLGNHEKADSVVIQIGKDIYFSGNIKYVSELLDKKQYNTKSLELKHNLLMSSVYLAQIRYAEALDAAKKVIELAYELNDYASVFMGYHLLYQHAYYVMDRKTMFESIQDAATLYREICSGDIVVSDEEKSKLDKYGKFYELRQEMLDSEVLTDQIIEKFHYVQSLFQAEEDIEILVYLYDYEAKSHYYMNSDLEKSIEIFDKANDISVQYNFAIHSVEHNAYKGYVYWHESDYINADKYLEKATELSKKYGVINVTMGTEAKLLSTKTYFSEYKQAYLSLSKLEYSAKLFPEHMLSLIDLFKYKTEYLCSMNSLIEARQLRYNLNTDVITMPIHKYQVKVIDVKTTYLTDLYSGIIEIKESTIMAIYELSKSANNFMNAKLFRELVSDIAFNLVMNQDISYISSLLKLDEDTISFYDNEELRIKRRIILASLQENSAEKIFALIKILKDISMEYTWRAYYMLGRIYYNEKNYIESLRAYLYGFEIIKDLFDKVPAVYHKSYIIHDPFKMMLKTNINQLIKIIGEKEQLYIKMDMSKIIQVDDYFDLSSLVYLLENDSISCKLSGRESIPDSKELMGSFVTDERQNLKNVLKYIAELVFAKRGFIFVLGEDESFKEVISLNEQDQNINFNRFIYGVGNEYGLIASKINRFTQVQLLKDDQKAMIYLPVMSLEDLGVQGRRKIDLYQGRNRTVAYLFLDTDDIINRFDYFLLERVRSYATLISVFINSKKLKQTSTIDKLTKVYLRKYFEQEFSRLLLETKYAKEKMSVIMIDIDNFKGVNDTYGHKRGDVILRKLGETLIRSVRSTDVVGRYGGEEFIVLLPGADSDSAAFVAEKIRADFENQDLLGSDRKLTISLGISTYPTDGQNEGELVENADKALYYSKEHGKNMVTRWDISILDQVRRFDKFSGILTGQYSEDAKNVQAILDIISKLDDKKDLKTIRIEVLDLLLGAIKGKTAELYQFNEKGEVVESLMYELLTNEIKIIDTEIDYANIKKYTGQDTDEYFIDWDNPIKNENDDMVGWHSVIVNSYYNGNVRGMIMLKVPISENEFDFSSYNFVTTLRNVLMRLLF